MARHRGDHRVARRSATRAVTGVLSRLSDNTAAMPSPPPRTTPRTLLGVGAWGAATAVIAYLVSGGNLAIFAAVMLLIGVAQRIAAVHIVRRRGQQPPRWWEI